ncbi:MAG: DUF4178 domain-containing protein [Rubrivivax sp.]|nr:DUF4178 domain-containing protein [Rubrivivax sp.]
MATEPPAEPARAQRAWRAACPNCGAPVDFRSAASTTAVCSFCRSTLARDGETLQRIGQAAELFDDHSPLQLGASGRLQGIAFTLVGRLQMAYAEGTWNEWHVLFDNGRSGWLSEDNGAYVLGFDTALPGDAPPFLELQPGRRLTLAGSSWDVASLVLAHVLSAQGELPRRPPPSTLEYGVVDLRNAQGEVATLDYADPAGVQFSVGRSASLAELAMQGLRETSEKTLRAGALNCPSCGAALELKLAGTQSLACPQCHALIDVSQGTGAQMRAVQQSAAPAGGRGPTLPIGQTGRLSIGAQGQDAPLDWQVVGYLLRQDEPEDGESPTPWSEYLLFNRTAGFAFLVDSSEGWSLVRPLTGAPETRGEQARWQGEPYRQRYSYVARVTWVEGEFYWRVRRDERARVTDYAGEGPARGKLMSREQTGSEVTWSAGRQMPAAEVAQAFGLAGGSLRPDVKPLASGGGLSFVGLLVAFFALLIIVLLFTRCAADDDCDDVAQAYGAQSNEYRQCVNARRTGGSTGGGSWGGSSGGGGHK